MFCLTQNQNLIIFLLNLIPFQGNTENSEKCLIRIIEQSIVTFDGNWNVNQCHGSH